MYIVNKFNNGADKFENMQPVGKIKTTNCTAFLNKIS